MPHQKEWDENAEHTIKFLKRLLGNTALDIQHIGSTSILLIHAKPIIDIAVAVHDVNDIMPYVEALKQRQILLHEEAVAGQAFFVIEFVIENGDIRTHHIHIVKWNGADWNNYINFRDYLNANPEKAMLYDDLKQKLAMQSSHDWKSYTAGKQGMIGQLLSEASIWKLKSSYLSGPAVIKADKR